jgi:hypothetical protein
MRDLPADALIALLTARAARAQAAIEAHSGGLGRAESAALDLAEA